MSQQDVRAAATHFRTSHHQPEVLGLDMLAAAFEAMRHRGLEAGPIASKALLDTVARLRFYRVHRDLPHSFAARQNIMIAPAAIRPTNAGVSASLSMTIFSTCAVSIATGMPPFVASLTCTNSGDVIGWPILLTSKH